MISNGLHKANNSIIVVATFLLGDCFELFVSLAVVVGQISLVVVDHAAMQWMVFVINKLMWACCTFDLRGICFSLFSGNQTKTSGVSLDQSYHESNDSNVNIRYHVLLCHQPLGSSEEAQA